MIIGRRKYQTNHSKTTKIVFDWTKVEDGGKKLDDKEIIRLFYERSEQAIVALEKKYANIFFSVSFNILKNRQDAEETLNEVYLAAWDTIPPQNPKPLLTYLMRIVRNISIKRYHKNSAIKRNSYYDIALNELEDSFSCIESVEEKYEVKELAETINTFLDIIDRKNKQIFVRRYYFADSIEEIAGKFSLSENNVSVRLYRIRKRLKKYLEKEGYRI
ncbi:MAG: RNA polymerase sigma factor [Clostridium sp.]|nr:RNA polymerase sigma factor [Clostridium sp.]